MFFEMEQREKYLPLGWNEGKKAASKPIVNKEKKKKNSETVVREKSML